MGDTDQSALAELIAEARESGGSELANYQTFVSDLARALGCKRPDMAKEETRLNDYVYERGVVFHHPNGTTSTGRIDCYKRDCFILEAKQSAKRQKARATEQLEMLNLEATQKLGQAKRGTRTWDKVMVAAKKQAEDYARALPVNHEYPPFLLIVDVGNVIEVFADFSGQGRNYAHFPDRQTYRLSMDDLLEGEVQDRLRAIWTDPHRLDPARISAAVTEDIAERLAKIAARLEKRHDPKDIAEFLMRCLFTMFAEDIELIPDHGFQKLLEQMVDTPANFVPALESLWRVMDTGGYAPHLNATLKRFNGALFKSSRALPLEEDDIRELWLASRKDWREVEPAIFGTLLERALRESERSMLGAHFTPRVYVERLVIPTVIQPLRSDWQEVLARVEDLERQGKGEEAREVVRDFHHTLATVRVLDPACGTGNFLYVSLELMKRLEGEVLEVLETLGDDEARLMLEGETVSPRQFFGLDLNPRAVPIADLVLWLGFLKWQLRTVDAKSLPEPILHAYGTIRQQDAILAYDRQELLRDDAGKPITVWDGETKKLHPITGEEIPDESARKEIYNYLNPRRASWPEAEFIVGNPPFIGGKDMRAELGDGYAEAAWKARPKIPGGADFVMHFWDEAASRLLAKMPKGQENPLRRFGFITTNSITQTFSRRVVERHLAAKEPLSLLYAVPDHPWLKASDKAAVRIAMTVAARSERPGKLAKVVSEKGLNTDTPEVRLEAAEGKITGGLRLGADMSKAGPLLSNESLSSPGVKLHGAGFIVTPREAAGLGLGSVPGLEKHIVQYRNGRDLASRPRGVMVIDLFGLSAREVQERFPAVYQYLSDHVRAEREAKVGKSADMAAYAQEWWLFGKTRPVLREGLASVPRYVATIETAKHRFFQFLDGFILPDNRLVNVAISEAHMLAVLGSRVHVSYTLAVSGVLEDRPIYTKSLAFDPFPFPGLAGAQSTELAELGERLDSFRKERLAEHAFLTMTDMYNVLERRRELEASADASPLSEKEKGIYEAGLISVLKDIHDEIDRKVFAAYGWDDLGVRLIGKPGATTPSRHKSEDQEAAEEELLVRLVVLNQERAAEERRGNVRWLRPEYQKPRLLRKVSGSEQVEANLVEEGLAQERPWPADGLAQIRTVRDVLQDAEAPLGSEALSSLFTGRNTQKRRDRVEEVLETLVATGAARAAPEGYFVPR